MPSETKWKTNCLGYISEDRAFGDAKPRGTVNNQFRGRNGSERTTNQSLRVTSEEHPGEDDHTRGCVASLRATALAQPASRSMPITASSLTPSEITFGEHIAQRPKLSWHCLTPKPRNRGTRKKNNGKSTLTHLALDTMSSQGGLSRRRVANQSTSSTTDADSSSNHDSRNGTTTTSSNQTNSQSHSHAGSAFRGGGGIAYDPRDLDVDEEDGGGGKLPRLTIMEEVLLLGLKDKQVRSLSSLLRGTDFRLGVTAAPNRNSFHVLHFLSSHSDPVACPS